MKKKLAFIFSGQGSQYVGMCKELYDRYSEATRIFDHANNVLGRDLKNICFNSDNFELTKTINTQPALYCMQVAIIEILKKYDIKPDILAGYSIGEYAAMYNSGMFDFTTGLCIVNQRAIAMEKYSSSTKYGMGAVRSENIEMIKNMLQNYENVWIANYNTENQITISGEKKAVLNFIDEVKNIEGNIATDINVSGAFHSPYMKKAAFELNEYLKLINIRNAEIPIIMNLTGNYLASTSVIKEIMLKQIYSPVYWHQSILKMLNDGVTDFFEIGPGKSLSNFINMISFDKNIKTFNIEDMHSLCKVIDYIYN